MSRRPSVGHARLVARVELVRRWRALNERHPLQVVALGFALLVGSFLAVGAVVWAYVAGLAVAEGAFPDPVGGARSLVGSAWTLIAVLSFFRTLGGRTTVDGLDGLLTTVPARDVVLGLVFVEYGLLVGGLGFPMVACSVAFALGAGVPLGAPLVLFAGLGALTTAFLSGVAAGFLVRNLLVSSSVLVRYRTVLAVGLFAAYVGLRLTGSDAAAVEFVRETFRLSPVGLYAHLGLVTASAAADARAAAWAAVGTLAAVPALLAATAWLAGRLWYADRAGGATPAGSTDVDAGSGGGPSTGSTPAGTPPAGSTRSVADRRLERRVGRPTARVVRRSWLRTRRAPGKLRYVVYPLVPLLVTTGAAGRTLSTGLVPASLPAVVGFYGAWATGVAFALNPLGEEGAVLPVTLTTGVDGRQFLAGAVLAGTLVGAPLTALATLVVGLYSPVGLVAVSTMAVTGAVLCLGACALATGVGLLLPRFDGGTLATSHGLPGPSVWALGVYTFALSLVAAPGLLVGGFAAEFARIAAVSVVGVVVMGSVLSVWLTVGAGWVSFRFAVRSFDRFQF